MADWKMTWAGQDVTSTIQWQADKTSNLHSRVNSTSSPIASSGASTPQPIVVRNTLGQGAGTGSGHSGRTSQVTFFTTLGPAAQATGAGQSITHPQLVRQGEIIVTDPSGIKVFGGYAGKLSDASIGKQVYTQVECYDYWQSLSRVSINEILDGITDVAAIVYLLDKYASWISTALLPPFASGTLLGRVWRNKTLQWALQTIADQTGNQIYVDPYKRLVYTSPTVAPPAPFSLTDTPNFRTSYPHTVDQFTVDDTALINRVTFYGGKKPMPDFTQDLSTQINGSSTVFMLAYYPRKSSNGHVQVILNGSQQAVGYVLGTGAANTLISQGGTAQVLVDADARTLTFDIAPTTGSTLSCIYSYQTPLVVEVTNNNSFAYYGEWFDGMVSDETVVDTATAVQRCRVILLEQAFGQTSLKVSCYQGGIQPGQLLTVVNSVKGINSTYVVQEVAGSPLAPGVWQYSLTLGAWNWNLVDLVMKLARAAAPSDLSQSETTTPTQVSVMTSLGSSVAVAVTPATRHMSTYYPGITPGNPGVMYPGLSSI